VAVILDTNALSAFADGDVKLLRAVENEIEMAVPVIVLGEYFYGIRRSRVRIRYERWLESNLPLFDVLAVGRETASHYADIRAELRAVGQPIPSNDIWIAALARERGSPLASRDRHFEAVRGLHLVSW
jgi:tRNA(fMet)-specific endonuclease VapC